ncbi:uncharacterized protein LOC112094267 [Morus notabilis]|uniref:uncharacterized protein LOC112094267 n=1 Tax=Morus notabilis TaxID=981085 RepID=UPI000CED0348|nr:uncharacterized protein LOC112094267 [Morus notabilis]
MAFLLSTSFSVPFSASNAFFKFQERHTKKPALVKPLRHPTYITATKLSISCSIIDVISSTNQTCRDHFLTPSSHQFEVVSYHMNVGSSHMIISGYWVGPDVDDGWGFIEAFINPIC